MRRLLTRWMVILLTASTPLSGNPPPSKSWSAHSGIWSGVLTRKPTGTCKLGDRSSRKSPIRVELQFTDGGEVSGAYLRKGSNEPSRTTLVGTIAADGSLDLREHMAPVCGGVERSASFATRGRLRERSDGAMIELEVDEEACPEQGCTFLVMLELRPELAREPGAQE